MLALYIILGGILGLIIIIFIFANIFLHKIFGTHFYKDELVNYYTNEEYNIDRKDISVKTKKGTLRGYVYNENGIIKDKIIILAHGLMSNVDAYNQEICYFAKNGYTVVALNNLGVENSDRKSMLGFSQGLYSLDHVCKYVKEEYKDRKIIVIGHSWGGFAASNIPYYHEDIESIILLAPFISIKNLVQGRVGKSLYFIIPFLILADYFRVGRYSFRNALKSLKNYKGKIILLASKDDKVINFDTNSKVLIDNFDVKKIITTDRNHNPDYTKEAIYKQEQYALKLSKATTLESKNRVKKNTNYHELGELDLSILNQVLNYIK